MQLLISLIGLVVATIPLVVAILPLLRQRTEETTLPLVSQSLGVLKIIRHPVEERIWEQIKRKYRRRIRRNIVWLSIFLLIIGFVAFVIPWPYTVSTAVLGLVTVVEWSILFLLYVLTITIYIIRYRNSFINLAADQARYFVFSEVEILIETEVKNLFDKCHETLRVLGNQLIEVDFEKKFLEAYKPSNNFSHFKNISVQIEALTNTDKCFHIQVTVTPYASDKKKDKISVGSEESSKIVNQFINYLISDSKPKK